MCISFERFAKQELSSIDDLHRDIGDDVNVGELVLEKNIPLGPAELGLLATVGLQTVRVYDKPHVVVLSTGNEVRLLVRDGKTTEDCF